MQEGLLKMDGFRPVLGNSIFLARPASKNLEPMQAAPSFVPVKPFEGRTLTDLIRH